MKLTLLGSGGWIPTSRRETCSALVVHGDGALLIDAGTGVSRLVGDPSLLEGASRLDIVLTHFHLDHVVGLAYLPALGVEKRLWGPGEWLYGSSTAAALSQLVDPPLFPMGVEQLLSDVGEVREEGLEAGGLTISARVQERHTHPTLAVRIGDAFAYCTDTALDEGNVEFASGASLLLHEAWHAAPATEDAAHSASGEAAEVAARAGVAELVLIHVNPLADAEEPLLAPARERFAASVVGQDLLTRDV